MNKSFVILTILCWCTCWSAWAGENKNASDSTHYPKIQVGAFAQFQGKLVQARPTNPADDGNRPWDKHLQLWRARVLVGGNISKKLSFFTQTEILNPIGFGTATSGAGAKNIQISPILLDAQIEYNFSKNWWLYSGLQYVGYSRNGLQSPVTLMGLEFGYYQFAYNLFANQPLQNNFGRDVGLNLRGYLLNDRLEVRAGLFRGRTESGTFPFRSTVRLNYNFLDTEITHYYTGTNLGEKKILAIGAGFDTQETYSSWAADLFADLPTANGAFTAQLSYMHTTGGTKGANANTFTALIPRQNIFFAEAGYYFKQLKLQPVVKYEIQNIDVHNNQYTLSPARVAALLPASFTPENAKNFNALNSNARLAFGLNYYMEGFNAHIKLQYEKVYYGRFNGNNTETKNGDEIILQFTYFIFK